MRSLTLSLAAIGLGAGCQIIEPTAPSDAELLVDACYEAVDDLLSQHQDRQDLERMLVSTVVDVNDVKRTTMFGRVTTEFLSARLTRNNVDVIHPTVREDHLLIQETGQFLLSRDVANLALDYNARTALVSTYAPLERNVIVSMKLVSTVENSTLAATDFVLHRSPVVEEMLESIVGWGR
ncbi:MAG: FlgO family outer membrane protein [Planctomycetota bacterium]|jgi:hypothetical protein|nr:FlgO family outer membrane protein [Planctomycetota bacterium]MDP6988495.1 FlgO family outer membrane protein [Planctomycetota bacterium]